MKPTDKPFTAPVLYGWPLVAAAYAVEYLPFVSYKLAKDAKLLSLREHTEIQGKATSLAIPESYILSIAASNHLAQRDSNIEWPRLESDTKSQSLFLSFWDYHQAYLEHRTTPSEIAETVIETLANYEQYHFIRHMVNKDIILEQAAASTRRYKEGTPKSQLDGIFIPVKEELDVIGLETKAGTSFLNDGHPAKTNATVVQRLVDAGAIIVGHSVMNELGWDTFTVNPTTGVPSNPYESTSSCGGSSGGSAGAVAANLFPIAIGCDGGGSVRIPAAFCGLYGLKTTIGRTSAAGGMPLDCSLAVSGPISGTADSLSLTYAIMSGVDEKDPLTKFQPPVSLKDYTLTHTLEGLTIGVMPSWNEKVDDPAALRQMDVYINYFKSLGAQVIEIDIPDLELAATAHLVTICSEMYDFASRYQDQRRSFSAYTRIMSVISQNLDARDYVRAQQVRGLMMNHLQRIFDDDNVDLILTPTTAIQAPCIPKRAHSYGLSNATWTTKSMEYTTLANLTGIPAVTIPSGFHNGKPLAIQLMATWFNEALLCRMAKVCELAPGIERKRPDIWFAGPYL
ncbi:amidase signature domain-containing protein [Halteromyces radiatus]|uniref:amidase signature domain-containing protein n=1 Tax=Halteromyces radiatus TaxID=101107 RepID=UPI00221E9F78|nr:amidase signature domain-containing protein [Halteromyces radiatus]KAI8088981.1 amidase signature domain-containing protein [Halteromyces radiatus]